MAKTNWQLNDIVMPADMNQIGTEINAKLESVNPEYSGDVARSQRFIKKFLGTFQTIGTSTNQKLRVNFPALTSAYTFNGEISLSVGGGYFNVMASGVVKKTFSGTLSNNNIEIANNRYVKLEGFIRDKIKVSDLRFDTITKSAYFLVEFVNNATSGQPFSIDLEINAQTGVSFNNLKNFYSGVTVVSWYADTEVLPPAYVQERQLQLTAPQGTAPLVVTSTTMVSNFNTERWNGLRLYNSVSEIPNITEGSETMIAIAQNMVDNSVLKYRKGPSNTSSHYPESTGFLVVEKKDSLGVRFTFENKTNEAVLNFYEGFYKGDTAVLFSGWKKVSLDGSPISSTQLTSTAPQGTAPLVVTSTTKVNNFNADKLDGYDSDIYNTPNTIPVRKANGALDVGGIDSVGLLDISLPTSNRRFRVTQDENGNSYIQVLQKNGTYINNPIQFDTSGRAIFNVGPLVTYSNPDPAQVRNIHQGRTAPTSAIGSPGDIYIEW